MSENLDLLKSLGLNSNTFSNQSSIIDTETQTHPKLRNAKIDIANIGTLKKQQAVVTVTRGEKAKFGTSIYEEYILEPKSKGFFAETEVSIPFVGQLSFFNPSKENNSLNGDNYFNIFVNEAKNPNNIYFNGVDPSLPYARFAFLNPNLSNTNTLNGFSYKNKNYNPIQTTNVSTIFTGKFVAAYSKNFFQWNKNNLPGESETVENLNNFYLSYPNTISTWNYNAYNIPVKLTSYMNYEQTKDLKGIILISTGTNENERICYISPHKACTGLRNTFIYSNNQKIITRFNKKLLSTPINLNEKFPTGIVLKTIFVDSNALNSGKCFPTGIRLRYSGESQITDTYALENYIKNQIPRSQFFPREWNNPYKIDSNSHIKQDTPIKNTAYYELYSGLYNSSRRLNTGTWDGIIPPKTPFRIELISCDYNSQVGTENIIYPIYSGYGTFDQTDIKIYESLSPFNLSSGETSINGTQVKVSDGRNLTSVGRGRGKDSSEAYKKAKENVKYILFNKFSNIIKNNVPDILYANRKLRKFLKYLKNKKNKLTNLTVSPQKTISSVSDPNTTETPVLGLPPLPDSFMEDLGYSYISYNESYAETTGIGNNIKFYDTLEKIIINTDDGDIETSVYFDQSNQYALWASPEKGSIRWYITTLSNFLNRQHGSEYFYVDNPRFWSDYSTEIIMIGDGNWLDSTIKIKLKPSRQYQNVWALGSQGNPQIISTVVNDPTTYQSLWSSIYPSQVAPGVDFSTETVYYTATRASVQSLRVRDLGDKQLQISTITTANLTPNIRYIFAIFPKKDYQIINGQSVI